jgi:hypothetical protein
MYFRQRYSGLNHRLLEFDRHRTGEDLRLQTPTGEHPFQTESITQQLPCSISYLNLLAEVSASGY